MDNVIKQNMPVKTTLHKDSNIDALRLDQAWEWLCKSRKTAPANADIWDLRHRWPAYRETFLRQLQSGDYRLSPMLVVGIRRQAMWSAEDALAHKWVALAITEYLPLHEKCGHVKGHRGGKSSIQRVSQNITVSGYRWVCRTDIKGYYGAINKDTLLSQLRQHLTRPVYLNILTQYNHYSVEDGGEFHTPLQGIARGCALSPLMGALHLWAVDNFFAQQKKCSYGRYMDDFVILTHSRWQLRKQVKQLNKYLASLGFQKHPDKTFIGKVSKGFDWLGAWLTDKGIAGVAPRALANHLEKVRRLYEQTRHWSEAMRTKRVSDYCSRWKIWAITLCLTPSMVSAIDVRVDSTYRKSMSLNLPIYADYTYWQFGEPQHSPAFITSSLTRVCPLGSIAPRLDSKTSDGYSGMLLAPDVVVGITGTLSGDVVTSVGTHSQSKTTLNETGQRTSSTHPGPDLAPWCAYSITGYRYTPTYTSHTDSTFVGSVFIHAGPLAEPNKTYNVPTLYFSMWPGNTNKQRLNYSLVPFASTVTVLPPLDCTISVQDPVVNFNRVQQKNVDRTELARYASLLTVSCSAGPAVPMTITASGKMGRWTDTLALTASEGKVTLAEVRGSISANPTSPCHNEPTRLPFNGTAVSIGNVGGGLTTIPLTWSLCSNVSGLKGTGQAQATINLNWP